MDREAVALGNVEFESLRYGQKGYFEAAGQLELTLTKEAWNEGPVWEVSMQLKFKAPGASEFPRGTKKQEEKDPR